MADWLPGEFPALIVLGPLGVVAGNRQPAIPIRTTITVVGIVAKHRQSTGCSSNYIA
jgi:hypothetical protein